MAKASPIQNVLEGELSPLAEGRTDMDRYPRGMRYMSNMAPCRTGPGIGRSGTYFECRTIEPDHPSKLLPFEFDETETLMMEFGHYLVRFHYEFNGLAANNEMTITSVISTNPFTFTVSAVTCVITSHLTFSNLDGRLNMNGTIQSINSIVGNTITMNAVAGAAPGMTFTGNETAAIVYEVATPYSRDDVLNLRIVQELDTCYLFCFKSDGSGEYKPYTLSRYDTFDWRIAPFPVSDGPYLDVNTTTTVFTPVGRGTFVTDMTSNTTPVPFVCAASSEVVGHEAWRAFDNNLDTYWEGNASQSGWLSYAFENGFVNIIPFFSGGPTSGAMTVSADSSVSGYAPWGAVDGYDQSFWQSSAVLPQAWYIDLGAAQNIREYRICAPIVNPEYAPRNFSLRGSNTGVGGPWTALDTRTGITWTSGQQQHFTVFAPGSYRYYSILTTAVNQKTITKIHHGYGTKGKKGYIPAYTYTTLSPNVAGLGVVEFSIGSGRPRVVDGYTIILSEYAKGRDVTDHAPKTWFFDGFDGVNWIPLHSQRNVKDWSNNRSQFFDIQNAFAYKAYRLRIRNVVAAGDVNPRIGKLVMSSPDTPTISLTASSAIGINNDQGFQATDVGRLIRLRDVDGNWRYSTITAVITPSWVSTSISSADPLMTDGNLMFWRLGLWSDNTGWPICGVLHEDRLFVGGAHGYPDTLVGSVTGDHLNFQQAGTDDTVLDTSAIVTRCNSRYMSRIVWLKSCIEAIRIGTGKAEYVLSTPTDAALTSSNVKMRLTTQRGSAVHESVFIDNEIVFLQTSQRALYDLAFSLTATGVQIYKSTLTSKLSAHLLQPQVTQIVYQQEPHSIIWCLRTDGTLVGITYTTDDDVMGGHRHDFSAVVKDICVVRSPTDQQDSLWMVAQRHINGSDVHYIERLFRFWDYGDVLADDATFIDSALRYYGTAATDKVYGLTHLEGQYLNVLADNITYEGLGPVTNGMLQLVRSATTIVVGLPYVMQGEIIGPEAGAQDGTAQGKSKRPHSVVLRLWESARGEVGRWNEDQGMLEWTPCEYNILQQTDELQDNTLQTCLTNTIVLPGGYGTLGTIAFRQTEPLPFNVAGVYPQTYVEDER